VYAKLQEKGSASVVYLPGAAPRAQAAPSPQAAPPAAGAAPALPATTAARVPLRADDPVRGPANAKVTIAVFSDFECPFCGRVEPTLRQLEQAFPGSVRIVWKHLPLPPSMHPQARPAAEAAEAAREQGKFWEMHDRLFAAQRSLSPETYESAARQIGLDLARFKRSLDAHAGAARIEEDQRTAASAGATATPTLFVNCRRIEGAYPFESIRPVVEEELRNADALLKGGTSMAGLYEAACTDNVRRFSGKSAAAAPAAAPAPAALAGGAAAVPVRRDDPAKGREGAPLTMVLFSDFQCPYCARATPTVKDIETSFPNDVRIVWKHLPLPFHPNAMPAALAAEAAREQGGAAKFWAMHDKLFSNQSALSEAAYEQYARDLGLDLARFKRDMADPRLRARVEEDAQLAQRLGVNGTPTFVVNGERVVGANGLRPAVERLLAQAKVR
jgi:protein-disulfide isomerase